MSKVQDVARVAEAGIKELRSAGRELAAMGITGKKLYATLAYTGILMILVGIFILLGEQEWRGGAAGFSPVNLLMPLVAFAGKGKAEGQLQQGANSASAESTPV